MPAGKAILWVNQFAATPQDGGGTRHYDLARALEGVGWQVRILASDFHVHRRAYTRRDGPDDDAVVEELVDGVHFDWLWSAPYASNNWRRLWNWVTFGWRVSRTPVAAPRPAIVIGSSPQLFAALGAWSLARRCGVPFVLEVRDLWPESLEAVSGRRGPFYHILGGIARFLYRRANAVIVLALGSIPVIVAAGVPQDRIWFLPNGVAPDTFPLLVRPMRRDLTLVYAGAHGAANGLETVLEAARLLADETHIRFILVGDGPAKPALRAQAHALALKNVRFLDPVAKAALVQLMSDADAALMVLKEASLFSYGVSPNKLFDYFGASLPVVCNVPGEVAEMVRAAGAGVQAQDGSAAALADAIRLLAGTGPEVRSAMGARGREWVFRERNRELIARELARLLDTLRP